MAYYDNSVILELSIIFPIIAIASVIFRFEARRIKRLKLEADDWTVLAASVFDIGVTISALINSALGNVEGLKVSLVESKPVDRKQYTIFSKTTYASELLIWPCVGLTKISVLLFYKRIFLTPAGGTFGILVWCMIWLAVIWMATMEFVSMFSCLPIPSRWDPTKSSSCIDQNSLFTAALSTDVITDGLILLLPIYQVSKLQMPLQRKLAVIGIFGLGALATIAGIVRLRFFAIADAFSLSHQVTRNFYIAINWAIIETNVVLSACLPMLLPLYEGYRIDLLVSKLSSFWRGSRSTTRLKDSIRLSSIEHGFSDGVGEISHRCAGGPLAVYDELESPIRRPVILPYRKDDQPSNRSQEDTLERNRTHMNH